MAAPTRPATIRAGQHGAQFAAHGHADHRQRGRVHFDLVELEIGLGAQHHARKGAGYEHDGLGFYPDEVNLIEEITPRKP